MPKNGTPIDVTTIKELSITKREQEHVTAALANQESDREDRRRKRVALAELRATELADSMLDGVPMSTGATSLETIRVKLSAETISLILKVLDKPLAGAQGLILGALEDKLLRLERGSYQLPADDSLSAVQ